MNSLIKHNNMKRKHLIKQRLKQFSVIVILFFTAISFGQEAKRNNDSEASRISMINVAAEGTYQFIISSNKQKYIFAKETFVMIERKRKLNEDITIELNQFVSVFIPSKNKINSNNFVQLAQYLYTY